jgi:ATP-binding cassette subfamily B (MDR/TAP) protein 1
MPYAPPTCAAQVGFGYMGQYLCQRVRTMLFGSMMRQEIGWFDMEENSSGRLNTMLSR